jgi:hypothetical protein
MKILIAISLIAIVGCATVPEDRNNPWRMTEHEKAITFEAMQQVCWEDAYTMGFARAYFGREAWNAMIDEMNQKREERRNKK